MDGTTGAAFRGADTSARLFEDWFDPIESGVHISPSDLLSKVTSSLRRVRLLIYLGREPFDVIEAQNFAHVIQTFCC